MDSRKCIFIGFLVLACLGLSSARRLLLDSYDPRMPPLPPRTPEESISNLAERSGSRSNVELMGMGTGTGGGFGRDCGVYGCEYGSDSGGSSGCGGPGGGKEGCRGSGSGGSFRCGGPGSECGEPIYLPTPRRPCAGTTGSVNPYLPVPGGSCPCSCDRFGVYSNSAALVQPEFAARMVMTSAGSNIGVNSEPAPQVESAPKRNQEDQMDGNAMAVDDPRT